MNHKTKLKELAAKAAGSVKELGLLPTKNRPNFDDQGNFNGMRESVDAKKTVAGAIGTTAVAGGVLAANSAIQSGFGEQGVESWKQAGRYAANEAGVLADKVPGALKKGARLGKASFRMTPGQPILGRAWKAVKAAGRGVAATVLDAKTPKARLKELAAKAAELRPFIGNTLTDESAIFTLDGKKIVHGNGLSASRFNEDGSSAIPGKPSQQELRSRLRIGATTAAAAGGLGFLAGKALRKAA